MHYDNSRYSDLTIYQRDVLDPLISLVRGKARRISVTDRNGHIYSAGDDGGLIYWAVYTGKAAPHGTLPLIWGRTP